MTAMNGSFSRRPRNSARRGSALYITVVGVTLIVSAIGLSAVTVARLRLRATTQQHNLLEARRVASSAVENALVVLNSNPNWRTDYLNNVEYPSTPVPLGDNTFTWKLVDDDAVLDDDESDVVRVYGIGRVGQQVWTESVQVQPAGSALTCLEASFHSYGQITLSDGVTWTSDQIVSTNGSIYADGSGVINGDGEAVGTIESGSVSGTATEGISPRQVPGSSVFEYYLANGTPIDINDLPGTSPRMMEKVVLSPGNNPYGDGTTNPEGVYVIDCQNQTIRIKLVRIEGTLVLLNPGFGSDLDNDQHWAPKVANFPVLLVDGDIIFNWHGEHELRESIAGVNYNPSHTPYQGQSDTDQTDNYPGRIAGLIYVSGKLTMTHECVLQGVVVVDTVDPQDNMTLTYDSTFLDNPPPGFRSGDTMEVLRGSWCRGPAN